MNLESNTLENIFKRARTLLNLKANADITDEKGINY